MKSFLLDLEIRQLRRDHDALSLEWEGIKREYYARKYDPNQPRVPAGDPTGGQWTSEDQGIPASARPILYSAASRLAAQKAIEAGLAFFTWLSARNGRNSRAIITFNASEFKPDGRGQLDLSDVKLLDRDQVDASCPRLSEVQGRTDVATEAVTGRRGPSIPRTKEIATNVFGAFPRTQRIIVTEIRPRQ